MFKKIIKILIAGALIIGLFELTAWAKERITRDLDLTNHDITNVGNIDSDNITGTTINATTSYIFPDDTTTNTAPVRTATLVVAASDSSAKSKAQADYVCDGTDDQVEIQAAIDALPDNGGRIILLEGIYHISETINLNKTHTQIYGMGSYATRIELDDHSDCDMLLIGNSGEHLMFCGLSDLSFHSSSGNQAGTVHAIKISGWKVSDLHINRVIVNGVRGAGLSIRTSNDTYDGTIEYMSYWNFWITNCLFEYALLSAGIEIVPGANKVIGRIYINNCYIIRNKKGLVIDGENSPLYFIDVAGSIFATNKQLGLYMRNVHHSSIAHPHIWDNNLEGRTDWIGDGLCLNDCENIDVIGGFSKAINNVGDYRHYHNAHIKGSSDYIRIQDMDLSGDVQISAFNIETVAHNRFADQHSDHFQDCLAASTNYIHAGITGTGAEQEITTNITNPDVPRNISVTVTNNGSPSGNVTITGVDAKGNSITEDITLVPGGTAYGDKAFATISKITVPATVNGGGADTVTVGIGDKLGLSNIIYETSDVYKIKVNNTDKTSEFDMATDVDTTNGTVDMSSLVAGGITADDDITIWFRSNLNMIN